MSRILAIGLATVWGGLQADAALELARAPVLNASLPASTTWQVEQQQAGGAWTGTGVLVGGSGVAVALRMDGFPATASYRFQRVAGGAATLTPTLSFGWNLAGQQPGAGQVVIESSADLAGWGQEALVFPGADGRYVRAIREPLGARGFFRAEVPALAAGDASVTAHIPAPNYQGAAGFGAVYDDMPQLFKDGFIGALDPAEYHRGGQNAAAAGECFELAGPHGRTTVIISDTTTAPPGTLELGRSFFDLGPNAFKVLSGGPDGGGVTAGVRLVPAPVTGNVKFFVPTTSGPFYLELRPYNYRAGVSKVEIQSSVGPGWVEMPRSPFNSFVYSSNGVSPPPLVYPVQVRVTSRFGEVVTFPPVAALVDNQRVTGPAQFTVFPESAMAPVPAYRVHPAYRDALTKLPGETWAAGGWGTTSITEVDPTVAYAGTASLKLAGLGGYSGATISQYPGFPRPEFGVMTLAIRSATPLAADQVALMIYGVNELGGPSVASALIQLPPLSTSWQVFRIPLEASAVPAVIWGFQFYGRTDVALPNVWVDEVQFENH